MPSSTRALPNLSVRVRTPPPEVAVVHWALRDEPVGSLAAVGLTAGLTWAAWWATRNAFVAVLVAFALALVLWRTWLPVQFELNGSGVTQSILGRRRRIPWTAIRSYEIRHNGVLLLPVAAKTPLAPLQGLYLNWGERRDEVLAHVEYYLQALAAAPRPAASSNSASDPVKDSKAATQNATQQSDN